MHRYFLVSFCLLVLFSCNNGQNNELITYLNHNDTVKYVGKQECKNCHADIYNSYMKTGMGKSFHFATKEHAALANSQMQIIRDTIKNLTYQPFWKNDSLYIKEFRIKGKDTTHLLVKKVDYKIGSGQHTNSHLYVQNGFVYQIPYTFYTQKEIADLPPGFEKGNNNRFSREIGVECMTCHNAYPHHDKESFNRYQNIPNGIDCERCHGPGELHVQRMKSGKLVDTSKEVDYSIVNPAKLSPDLQFDICQRCHLQGTAILAPSKTFFSFRPGMPLHEVMDIYLPKFENNESFIMASHVDRLKQSACFKGANLTCINCHHPHKSVTQLKYDYFDNQCKKCHPSCKDEQKQKCATCHMPKSDSKDIPHVSITDHKIAIPTNLKKEKGKFLGLFAINNNSPTNLSKAMAYLKHYESFENNPIYLDSAFRFLQNSDNHFPSFVQYYYLKRDENGLINYVLSTKIDSNKYSNNQLAMAFSRVGEAFASKGLFKEANRFFTQSVKQMPKEVDFKIKYGIFLLNQQKYDAALSLFLASAKLNPTRKEVLLNLGYLYLLNGNMPLAKSYLQQAIAVDPDYVLAYENLVLLAQKENNKKEMIIYLQTILDIDPNHKAKRILQNL